jgi:hypothetical protein
LIGSKEEEKDIVVEDVSRFPSSAFTTIIEKRTEGLCVCLLVCLFV